MKLIPIKIQPYNEEQTKDNIGKFLCLAKKDERFLELNQLIELKKKMLNEKQKKINVISKQNIFLEEIKEDYSKYHSYIIQQKKDQIKALELLNTYIDNLSISGKLSKQNLTDSKQEQKKIIEELNLIKTNLDSIIKDTDTISNNFK